MNTVTESHGFDWRWLALSLSLVCNIFLAAVIAGHFLSRRVDTFSVPTGGTPLARALERTQAVLSAKDAATFRAVLERDEPRYGQAAIQVALARGALEREIAAEPFDPRAASRALALWRTSWSGFVDDFSGPLIEALAAISAQGRSRLVIARRAREQRPGRASPTAP